MGDVSTLVKRLSLPQSVAAKAAEYARLLTARMGPGGLGQVISRLRGEGEGCRRADGSSQRQHRFRNQAYQVPTASGLP